MAFLIFLKQPLILMEVRGLHSTKGNEDPRFWGFTMTFTMLCISTPMP